MEKRFIRLWSFLTCPRTPDRNTSECPCVSLALDGVGTFHGLTIEQSLRLLQWNSNSGSGAPQRSS